MRVFTNTAVSLDGRIGPVDRSHVQLGTEADRERMSVLRAQADAVLVGGQTFRNWPMPAVERDRPDTGRRSTPIINAVLTRRGIVDVDLSAWSHELARLIVYTSLDAPSPADIEVARHGEPNPAWVLDQLAGLGCQSVLVEAGGDLIFQLLAAGRVDELFVTLCPRIIGGVGAPSLADGMGFDAGAICGLKLIEADPVGDEIFLHYRVSG